MIKGKTPSGFVFEIDEAAMDDMELVEALAKTESDATAIVEVLNRILGENQKQKLYEHIRGENGRVSAQACAAEIEVIFKAAGDMGKNS